MRKVINPKTNKPYTQDEMQTAFENSQELEYYVKVPDGKLLFSMIPHREYIVDKEGLEKEVYSL